MAGLLFLGWSPFLRLDSDWMPGALFVTVPVVFAAVFAALWLLAADLIEESNTSSARWVYSRLGASSLVGGLVGGLAARMSEGVTAAGLLLWIGQQSGRVPHPESLFPLLLLVLILWLGGTFLLIRLGCGQSSDHDYMIRLPDA